jgi:hypothetical protein
VCCAVLCSDGLTIWLLLVAQLHSCLEALLLNKSLLKKWGLFTQITVEFQNINYKIFVLKCIIPPSTETIYVFTYKQTTTFKEKWQSFKKYVTDHTTLFFNHTVSIPLRGTVTLVLSNGQESRISCNVFPSKKKYFFSVFWQPTLLQYSYFAFFDSWHFFPY